MVNELPIQIMNGTIMAFTKHGTSPFINKDLQIFDKPILIKQAISVAEVPIKISIAPTVENTFASKHPKVRPIVYHGLKKTRRVRNSETRNCIYS